MVYFKTKSPNLGIFWRALEWKMLVYFMAIWYNVWPFGVVCGHFGIFSRFGILVGILGTVGDRYIYVASVDRLGSELLKHIFATFLPKILKITTRGPGFDPETWRATATTSPSSACPPSP
jgi:hypothetical protein